MISTALEIIDTDGLAACSLPRLARELEVKAPSLYHHFADRAEIMAGVARSIVLEAAAPRRREPADWQEWLVTLAVNFRRVVLRHPNAAPVLLEHVPRDLLSARYDDAAQLMRDAGVPEEVHVLILDGLENLTLGAALTQAVKPADIRNRIFPHVDAEKEPALASAVKANEWRTGEKLFAESIRSFLRGAVQR
ncbi:transcriptional regulator [Amycolatopsis methanolica 239]|uniref:Transcriptional regulator n=1 Tax=Amycolatopsis methanolica 239 TaxID=1068978 RepID=A0A076N0F4_AMYME|nr:transcriptional regulator [Amycolatopsis methanolica 239]